MAAGRFIKFASGGLFGAGVGTALAILFAPRSGETLRAQVHERIQLAKLAGIEAQAETEAAVIARYRAKMGDQNALADYERELTERRAEQVREIGREGEARRAAAVLVPDAPTVG
ncbi:MAG TPA: YtxH domain-containing protein [Thermomicrobiales bacterium]|jgi:gas vesicle protein|nr:YtxH domain-containing protein [Thermomicrobiales bacterium]